MRITFLLLWRKDWFLFQIQVLEEGDGEHKHLGLNNEDPQILSQSNLRGAAYGIL